MGHLSLSRLKEDFKKRDNKSGNKSLLFEIYQAGQKKI